MGKRHTIRHERSWTRHHRKRTIANGIRMVRGWHDSWQDWLENPGRVGQFAKTAPLFCGCTKTYGTCKYDKHRHQRHQERRRNRAVLLHWEREY